MMADTGSTPGYKRFLADLKRRQVFKVAAVYGAVAFVVLQVADLLQEGLQLPASFLTVATVFALLGFPIAIVLAWAYERTPEGVKRTGEAAPGELTHIASAPAAKRWPIGLAGVAGGALLAASAFWILSGTGVSSDGEAAAPEVVAPAGVSGAAGAADDAGFGAVSEPVDERSVAVLPFAVQTADDESREFALGLHDDLLTQLARIPDLAVTSRTSVMTYENTTKSIDEIASELGVASLVEGGVRHSGQRVRINVQLIDADTDEHLWAETFDREYTAENVFAIQADIAAAVASALQSELSAEDVAELTVAGTDNIEAWNAYHRGRRLWGAVGSEGVPRAMLAEYRRAVGLDPGFVAAWAGLVRAEAWLLRRGLESDTLPARQALDRLRALAPDAMETHFAAGYYLYYALADFATAYEEFKQAESLQPANAEVTEALAYITRRLGLWDESVTANDRALRLDPRSAALSWNAAFTYQSLRRLERADALYARTLGLRPDANFARLLWFGLRLRGLGDSDGARAVVNQSPGFSGLAEQAKSDHTSALYARDFVAALVAVDKAVPEELGIAYAADRLEFGNRWTMRALAHRLAGDASAAEMWADSGVIAARIAIEARPVPETGDRFGVAAAARVALALALSLRDRSGDSEEAVESAQEAIRIYGIDRDAVDGGSVERAALRVFALAGAGDEAFELIDRLLSQPSRLGAGELRLSPVYDDLRDDPHFQELLARAEEMYGL